MTDSFALLNEPRRPWLDLDACKGRFLELSTATHPDRAHGAPEAEKEKISSLYAELNAAWRCLGDPKERLGHLLELELGRKPPGLQTTPAGALDLFMQVGRLCREADRFVAERSRATSPMIKAQFFIQGLEWTDQLQTLQGAIRSKQGELDDELRSLNPIWAAAPPPGNPGRASALPLARLEELYRLSSYLARWNAQVQERVVQLSLG